MGDPAIQILARETNDDIDLRRPEPQTFTRIENDDVTQLKIKVTKYAPKPKKEQYMLSFPVPPGKWRCVALCEGYQATADQEGGKEAGKIDGFIAYDGDDAGWGVANNTGKISNFRVSDEKKYGHPDYRVNDCGFTANQVVERDAYFSFHFENSDDALLDIVTPYVQRDSGYNYCVSYGAWTKRSMEFGVLTISLDEVKEDSGPQKFYKGKPLADDRSYLLPHSVGLPRVIANADLVALSHAAETTATSNPLLFVEPVTDSEIENSSYNSVDFASDQAYDATSVVLERVSKLLAENPITRPTFPETEVGVERVELLSGGSSLDLADSDEISSLNASLMREIVIEGSAGGEGKRPKSPDSLEAVVEE